MTVLESSWWLLQLDGLDCGSICAGKGCRYALQPRTMVRHEMNGNGVNLQGPTLMDFLPDLPLLANRLDTLSPTSLSISTIGIFSMSLITLNALKTRPTLYRLLTARLSRSLTTPTMIAPSGALSVLPNEVLALVLEYVITEAATTLSACFYHLNTELTPLSLLLTCRRFRAATEWVLYNRSTLIIQASPFLIGTPRFAPFSTFGKAFRFGRAMRRLLRLPLCQEYGGLHRFRRLHINLAPMSNVCLTRCFKTLCDFMRPIAEGRTNVVHSEIALVPASNIRLPAGAMPEPWLFSDFMEFLKAIDQSFNCDLEWVKLGQWSVEPPPLLIRAADEQELEDTIDEVLELLKLQMDVGEGTADLTGRTRLYSLMLKHVYSHRHTSGSRFGFSPYGNVYERTYVLMPDGERKEIVGTRGDASWKKWQKKCDDWQKSVNDLGEAVRQVGWEMRIDGELDWREKHTFWYDEVEKLDVELRAILTNLKTNFWDGQGLELYEAEMVVWETESLMALEAKIGNWGSDYLCGAEEKRKLEKRRRKVGKDRELESLEKREEGKRRDLKMLGWVERSVERLRRADRPEAEPSNSETATQRLVVDNGGTALDRTEEAVDGTGQAFDDNQEAFDNVEETVEETWSDGEAGLEVQMKWRAETREEELLGRR